MILHKILLIFIVLLLLLNIFISHPYPELTLNPFPNNIKRFSDVTLGSIKNQVTRH